MINVLNRALLYKDTNSEATAKVWSALRKEGIEYAVDTKVNSAVTGKNKGHLSQGVWPGLPINDRYSGNAASYIYEVWVRRTDLERAKEVCSL
jgi:hypothetical protein